VRRGWSFIGKKEKRVRPEGDQNLGDCYTFVAVERHSKLVLNIAMGKRDQATTDVFIEGLRQATTTKLTPRWPEHFSIIHFRRSANGQNARSPRQSTLLASGASTKKIRDSSSNAARAAPNKFHSFEFFSLIKKGIGHQQFLCS